MKPMHLEEVERAPGGGGYAALVERARGAGMPVAQIWHLFKFKPDATKHLAAFTHAVMRGPSPLSAGERELIAAFTSARNQCPF